MVRETLDQHGFKVGLARDGESALRRLGQYHYDSSHRYLFGLLRNPVAPGSSYF